jgi:peptide deformylase
LTVREIRLYGDPVLRSECEAVESLESVKSLVQDLLETTALPGRAGVAANQIGVGLRVFAYNINGEIGYLINPSITSVSGELVLMEEGCLSVPGLWHPTPRYESASAQGLQLDGSTKTISGTGLMAQAIQHECDHLDGKVYLQRLEPQERKLAMGLLRQQAWFKNG